MGATSAPRLDNYEILVRIGRSRPTKFPVRKNGRMQRKLHWVAYNWIACKKRTFPNGSDNSKQEATWRACRQVASLPKRSNYMNGFSSAVGPYTIGRATSSSRR